MLRLLDWLVGLRLEVFWNLRTKRSWRMPLRVDKNIESEQEVLESRHLPGIRMRFSLGQFTTQKQIQKLAPRMIQSMEILQLPFAGIAGTH